MLGKWALALFLFAAGTPILKVVAIVLHLDFSFLCWISFRGHPVLTLRVKIQCADDQMVRVVAPLRHRNRNALENTSRDINQ